MKENIKTYDEEYLNLFEQFTDKMYQLEEQVSTDSFEFHVWYGNFESRFKTIYHWNKFGFSLLKDDSDDYEYMLEDLVENNCKTFAQFSLMYMSNYVAELTHFIKLQNTKEEN